MMTLLCFLNYNKFCSHRIPPMRREVLVQEYYVLVRVLLWFLISASAADEVISTWAHISEMMNEIDKQI